MNRDFSYYLSKYLKDYLIIERNLSSNTIRSYKNTFQLLIDYLVNIKNLKLSEITFSNITREIIIDFLNYLEETKRNTTRTRNQRLAAIKAFYQYCAIDEVENIDNINKILSIKSKKYTKKVINYLTESELKQIFDSIDTTTRIGRRDLTLLSLLYDTAARASEIINLKFDDIHLEDKYVILTGKGNKQRVVPIMNKTCELLKIYFRENYFNNGYLISNNEIKCNKNILADILSKYAGNIKKKISPHVFRHTRAVHLLDNGIQLIYIKELLGHSSITTTEEYAKVIEKRKIEALEKTSFSIIDNDLKDWNNDKDLLNQLLNM